MARVPRRRPERRRPTVQPRAVEVAIDALGGLGDGIGHLPEGAVYVPYTVPGDRVLARIDGRRGDGLTGRLIEVLESGPARVSPVCRHFADCGGCALQHQDRPAHAEWKRDLLVRALSREGLGDAVAPLIAIAAGTRRRAAFAYVRRGRDTVLGFNAHLSHRVVEVVECPILLPALVGLLPRLRPVLAAVTAPGGSGDVVVTATEGGLDVLVEGEAALDLSGRESLAAFAAEADLARLSWRLPGREVEPLLRRRSPVVTMGGVAVEPPPGAFLQPSAEGERAIAALVLGAVAGASRVADLFAGCGSFTFPLAGAAAVHAVEGEAAALAALRAAADRDGLRVTAEWRDLTRRPLAGADLKRFDAVVFDPPRAGAAAQAQALAEAGPPVVVGVSCNPATLARDAATLTGGGYRLETVTPVDQFPWSPHLEAVAVFRR